MNIWLDDLRPCPVGFVLVQTAQEAITLMQQTDVEHINRMSLDHDLGTCEACGGLLDARDLPKQCEHNGTGYDVVCWMEEQAYWPQVKPIVHSANPVGRARMQQVIDRAYGEL